MSKQPLTTNRSCWIMDTCVFIRRCAKQAKQCLFQTETEQQRQMTVNQIISLKSTILLGEQISHDTLFTWSLPDRGMSSSATAFIGRVEYVAVQSLSVFWFPPFKAWQIKFSFRFDSEIRNSVVLNFMMLTQSCSAPNHWPTHSFTVFPCQWTFELFSHEC